MNVTGPGLRQGVGGMLVVLMVIGALLPFAPGHAQPGDETQIAWSGLESPIALRAPGGVPPYTAIIDAPPAHGSLAVGSETVLLYTADASYVGTDAFTYTLTDARGQRHSATVALTVVEPAADTAREPAEAASQAAAPLTTTVPAEVPVSDTYILRYARGASPAEIDALVARVGAVIVRRLPQLHAVVIRLEDGTRLEALASAENVIDLEQDLLRMIQVVPTDPGRTNQWALNNLHLYDAWDTSKGTGEIIAILDSGIDLDHPDLAAHLLPGYDFVGDDANPAPDATETHGSHVAGIANAVTDNGIGMAGVAWDARTLPVRIVSVLNGASSSDIAAGIVYATDSGAKIINLSLGGPGMVAIERDAVLYAVAHGVLIVAAAGNENSATPYYPASYDHVLSVASTTSTNTRSSFSNTGAFVDIAGPGSGIYSTIYDDTYDYKNGTSMASPAVAGVAALVRAAGITDLDDLTAALLCTALDLGSAGRDNNFGWGLVQADQAVAYVPGVSCLPVVPHDARANARLINSSVYTDTIATGAATGWEDDPPLNALFGTDCTSISSSYRTVWYRYEPFAEGTLEIDTVGSTYNTVVGVYTATGDTLTPAACNDDADGGIDTSSVELDVDMGQPLYIMVSAADYESDIGTLTLNARFITSGVSGCAPLPSDPSVIICTTG